MSIPSGQKCKRLAAAKKIEVLQKLFSAYGLPEQLVSDNGPQFVLGKFAIFVKQNDIKHIRTAPYLSHKSLRETV